jgi:hypothetical protein
LRKLNTLVADAGFQSFAKTEWLYADRDWERYRFMVDAVAQLLHDRCVAGSLLLDLDVQAQLGGTSLGPTQGCE